MNRILPGPRLDPFADVIRSRMTVYRQIEFLRDLCTFSTKSVVLHIFG